MADFCEHGHRLIPAASTEADNFWLPNKEAVGN
jgi:hypothetical protein